MNGQVTELKANGTDMAARIQTLAWAQTPVGPQEAWPQSLRSTIKLLLGSRYPMILLWGEELIQIYNDAYTALIGDKHPYALGKSIRHTQAESWEVIGPMIREVMTTGVSNWVPRQLLAVNRSGFDEETYFSLSYSAVENDNNEIAGMLCVCSEITQQVLAERRLRIQRDIAASAADAAGTGKVFEDIAAAARANAVDLPFMLLYVLEENRLVRQVVTGLSETGALAAKALLPDELPYAPWQIMQAMQGETVILSDVQQQAAIKGGLWNSPVRMAVAVPLPGASPARPLGVLVAGINPGTAPDESCISFYQLLAGQISVAVRNARAYEEEKQRVAYLAELDRAKTTFFNNISHEFRTPLTLMLGPLRDLLNGPVLQTAPEAGQQLQTVYSNAVRLLKLVNALLDYSRIEAHRMQPRFSATELPRLTASLISSFQSAVEKENLYLRVQTTGLSSAVYVDGQMWEKIVFNLLSNALKHTFEGGITVILREERDRAVLEVSDTGVGIPASDREKIFERFHRVPNARSRSHEGTGIGLALTKELVGLHGGTISVTSKEGQGSTFTVTIPKGTAHLNNSAIVEADEVAGTSDLFEGYANEIATWSATGTVTSAAPAAGDELVLIVDDNQQMATYIEQIIGRYWKTLVAKNGAQAIELARSSRPDLVLSDVMMPVMNGLELLAALRSDDLLNDVPVILLSARAGKEATVEGLQKGANDYLIKPFYADELVARVRTQLQLRKTLQKNMLLQVNQEQLERRVKDRTGELVAANAELEQFAFAASHDLQEPLRKILLYAGLLETAIDAENEKAAGYMGKITSAALRMRSLISDLLNFSRLGNKEMDFIWTDLNVVVNNVLADLEASVTQKQARIICGQLPAVMAVPLQMQQLFYNLIANALKFTHNGRKPVIHITAIPASREEDRLPSANDDRTRWHKLEIADNGIGFDQQYAEQIFVMFQKLHDRSIYEGTGIGLALCKKVVQNHGGVIRAGGTPDEGAIFTILIPETRQKPSVQQ